MHAAMLLGAARLLVRGRPCAGCVKLYFQPAEELLLGAEDGILSGILETPKVDFAIGIHVLTGIPLGVGALIIPKVGIGAPASQFFTVRLHGTGCHGATPQNGTDAINCLGYLLTEYNSLVAKEIKHLGAELTIGRISGGSAPNAIADSAMLEGTLRAATIETIERVKERFIDLTMGLAACHGVKAEIGWAGYAPPLLNDRKVIETITPQLVEAFGKEKVISADMLDRSTVGTLGGSEDFASFLARVPGCLIGITAGEPRDGYIHPLHHPGVNFDERALVIGAEAIATAATALLSKTTDK